MDIHNPPESIKEEKPELGHRARRRLENLKFNEFVIKSSLKNTFNSGLSNEEKNILIASLTNRSIEMSKGYQRLSYAVNILCLEYLESNKDLPTFLSDKNTTFFRQLLLGPSNRSKTEDLKDLEEFLNRYKEVIPPVQQRFKGDKNTVTNATEDYITNFKNYLKINFEQFLKRYIASWTDANKLDSYKSIIYHLICYNKYNYREYEHNQAVTNFVNEQRELLGLNNNVIRKVNKDTNVVTETVEDISINDTWFTKNYEVVIKYYHTLSKYFISKKKKGLLKAPVGNAKRIYIHIDSDVFYYILKELPAYKNVSEEEFKNNKEYYWFQIFNTKKYISKKKQNLFNFTFTIETDGHSVSIHYRRPKLEPVEKTKDQITTEIQNLVRSENVRIIGVDSGRKNLLTMAELNKDGETYKIYQLTKEQFYEESGLNKHFKFTQRRMRSLKVINECLSRYSTRNNLNSFLLYCFVVKYNYNKIWNHMTSTVLSRKKMEAYSGRQKVYSNFFQRIKNGGDPNKEIVIAYGDGGFSSNGFGEKSAPTTRLFKETKKRFKTFVIDEYNTSKRYHKQEQDGSYAQLKCLKRNIDKRYLKTRKLIRNARSERVINKENIGKTWIVRGLLKYSSPSNKSVYVSRDVNPAKTMAILLKMYPQRPFEFTKKCKNTYIPAEFIRQ